MLLTEHHNKYFLLTYFNPQTGSSTNLGGVMEVRHNKFMIFFVLENQNNILNYTTFLIAWHNTIVSKTFSFEMVFDCKLFFLFQSRPLADQITVAQIWSYQTVKDQ